MKKINTSRLIVSLLLSAAGISHPMFGQLALPVERTVAGSTVLLTDASSSSIPLPDAPSIQQSINEPTSNPQSTVRFAPKYANTIEPEYRAQPLGATGKMAFAATELVSWHYDVGAVIAAGFSHGTNSNPKYGTNSEAFAERVGAAAARAGGQIVFSKGVLAPILHEDTRYYVLGSGHGVFPRIFYAASRVLITRTDSGHQTVNIAELAGYGGSAALTQFYYPKAGRGRDVMLEGYGASLGGLAIQNEIAEFARFLVRHQPR